MAAIASMAIAYWLQLQDPQWAVLTVYLLAQPTAGAAVAKGAYRIVGTVIGAIAGLIVLSLYSQAPLPLVGSIALILGFCFFVGTQMRNYAAYGFLLAGYTALLVGLEGAFDPIHAWRLAFDRTAEIVIGIACITAVSVLVFPRYAGTVLREQLAALFRQLCHYGAVALRPETPLPVFVTLRQAMVGAVVKFDALRSYTVFEAQEMRADDATLRRMVHEFLRVLAVARGLYIRIERFQGDQASPIADRLRAAIAPVAASLDRIAGDPGAFADPHRIRAELLTARASLNTATAELEAMSGRVPLEPLADALLILRRAGDLLHGLSMVVVSEAASLRRTGKTDRARRVALVPVTARAEALLHAVRSALALMLLYGFWAATEWTEGFTAVSGLAIILFLAVNQDRPGKLGFAFLLWSGIGIAAAYASMIVVLPRIEGFEALALFLLIALLPAGLMTGTPQHVWRGIAFGGFLASEIGTSNLFRPDEPAFVNSAVALLVGMAACLMLLGLFPVNSLATRGRVWAATIGHLLPEAARGERHERVIVAEIVAMLAGLLPRLSLDRPGEDDFLRGMLGAASTALELGRLNRVRRDPGLPAAADAIISALLARFAAVLETIPKAGRSAAARVEEGDAVVRSASSALAALQVEPGSAAAALTVRAAASLRFISDRFEIDRVFLTRPLGEM